jgi:hypothetical protein
MHESSSGLTVISPETAVPFSVATWDMEHGALESVSEGWKRWLFGLYLVFVAGYSIWTAVGVTRGDNPWIIGDWLINYSGGFVRRGLTGALVMLLHHATGIPLQWVVFWIQTGVFLLFLVCVYRLTRGMRWSYLMVTVLLSPATLAFTVLEPSGFRKEILLFAALGLAIWMLISERWTDWQMSAILSILLVGLALSHEGMMAAGPYFFAAVLIQTKNLRRAVRMCAMPLALTVVALVALILHHGNLRETQAICSSVGGQMAEPGVVLGDGGICTGAIAAMQLTRSQERSDVILWVRKYHLLRLCGWLAIPTFAPLLLLIAQFYRRDGLRYEVAAMLACVLVSLPGFAMLFYIGADWGRWVHMLVICPMLLAMMIDCKTAGGAASGGTAECHRTRVRALATLALLVYATVWHLPSVGGEPTGYVALVWPMYHTDLGRIRVAVMEGIRKAE